MRVRIAGATLAVAALVPLTAWLMAWPVEKAAYLAPVPSWHELQFRR